MAKKKTGAAVSTPRPARPSAKKSKPKKDLGNKFLAIPELDLATRVPAYRYANMTNEEVERELSLRGIRYHQPTPTPSTVRFPIRLDAPLHGVTIHSALPAEERADTPFEILDGRLALALDDFCEILERHDVVEVVHFTMYRPAPEQAATDAEATRHPAGLAIDVGALRKRTGHWLAVGPSWSASIGSQTCGTGARALADRSGREILSIVCEAADQQIFHYMLTPHFNEAHRDHLHLEIKPGVKWFLYN
ncbi:MAG: extensin family protein [Polyangiaceae bacterium]|nr:extensin family protein [Polyangiaceae bacterium]